MTSFARASTLAALLATLGCATSRPAPKPSTRRPEAKPQVASPKAAEPVLELTSPGAEPRRTLRYRFTQGRVETAQLEIAATAAMQIDGTKLPPTEYPTAQMKMRLEPEAVTPEGNARVRFAVTDIEVVKKEGSPKELSAALEHELASLKSLAGFAVISARGQTLHADFHLSGKQSAQAAGVEANFRDSVRRMTSVLPREPVGVGATWTLTSAPVGVGVSVRDRVTYTLTRLEGDRGELRIETAQDAARQPMPVSQPGVAVTLDRLVTRGKGTVGFELDRLTPRSEMAIQSDMQATSRSKDRSQTMQMRVTVDTKMSRVEP